MDSVLSRFRRKRKVEPGPKEQATSESTTDLRGVSKPTAEQLKSCEIHGPKGSPVYRIDADRIAKAGEHVRMAEAFAMNYVREHTSIPVPRVTNAYLLDDSKSGQAPRGCIIMEFVDGQSLDNIWPSLTVEQKQSIVAQLKGYMDELRTLWSTQISSVDGSRCNDPFFTDNPTVSGPFACESHFRDGLAAALRAKSDDSWTEMIVRFINQIKPGIIVLTHNDFAPRNILVKGDRVVALLDWENAGFYPEYWEYVKALFWPDWQSPWVTEGVVDKILHPYTTELALLLHARELIW